MYMTEKTNRTDTNSIFHFYSLFPSFSNSLCPSLSFSLPTSLVHSLFICSILSFSFLSLSFPLSPSVIVILCSFYLSFLLFLIFSPKQIKFLRCSFEVTLSFFEHVRCCDIDRVGVDLIQSNRVF